ncbi:MAG: FtsQ-type POTRA domain-containing protein [Anaerolineales bacterium]|nr:FtsQ-type POTRA domain-containing protein [Anaerolineales bacterium]
MSDKKHELSRAEVARRRRAQRSAKELHQTTQRAVKPVQTVKMRATTYAKPTFVAVEKPRRYRVALGVPDIHLRKPNFGSSNQYRGWRAASLGVAALIGLTIYLALTLPFFKVPSITTLGNNRISREEITTALGVLGQSIFTVQPNDAAQRLQMNYPELLSAKVDVYLPNHVYVTVVEREPVILWQQNGAYTWIDAEGVAFRPHGNVGGLASVIGLATPPQIAPPSDNPFALQAFMSKELVDAVLTLAPNVPADTTMFYDATYGLGWQDSRGWKVFFGSSAHDMSLKARVYQTLAQSLVERNISPTFISVIYPDAPYYRMSDEVQPATANNGQ